MIDLHSHLLPGVDDGSRSVEQSVAVLRRFAEQGITGVCLTPHVLASNAWADLSAHDHAFEALRLAAPALPVLSRGAEIMLDRPLEADVAADRRLTLGGTRYMLIEFPRLVTYEAVAAAIRGVVAHGLTPIVAHPERYHACSPENVSGWRSAGALMQVDATTITMQTSRGDRARALVSEGLADILAGDNHGDDRSLRLAYDFLLEHNGRVQAELLLSHNPRAILADGAVSSVEPLPLRTTFVQKMIRLLGRERP